MTAIGESSSLPALELDTIALARANAGPETLLVASHPTAPFLLVVARDKISILDQQQQLLQTLPFSLAFPSQASLSSLIDALAYDIVTGRIAATSGGRVAVWERSQGSWRVHSSFTAQNHSLVSLDYVSGTIVVGGDGVSVWKLEEDQAWAGWKKVGMDIGSFPVLSVRLSPSAQILASVKKGSSMVRMSSIVPSSSSDAQDRLRFRSYARHSVQIRSIGWRPSEDPTGSYPILFTTTLDGIFRIWGCMIDEPDFFSLWATLDVHSTIPSQLPLATCYWKTIPTESTSSDDLFVTVLSDGTTHLTTVSNFDCRPPTCISQSTSPMHATPFSKSQLSNLRHTVLVPSSTPSDLSLIARCSRGSILRLRLSHPRDDLIPSPERIEVNVAGAQARLVSSSVSGDAVVTVEGSRVQVWEIDDDDVVVEKYVADLSQLGDVKVAIWHNGTMMAAISSSGLRILELRQGHLSLVTSLDSPLPDIIEFWIARTDEESLSTTVVAITHEFQVISWTYTAALHQLHPGSTQSLTSEAPIFRVVAVPRRQLTTALVTEVSILAIEDSGTFTFWTAAIPESTYVWKKKSSVRSGRGKILTAACSSEQVSAVVSEKGTGGSELSIWDSKESEFTSGQRFVQDLSVEVIALQWSLDAQTLAVMSEEGVKLYCAQRLDDLSGTPSWMAFALISVQALTSSPISAISWFSTGLAISSGAHLLFFASKLTTGEDCHELAASRSAPLPNHHPQLLFQALLHGETALVIRILVDLAAQLTADGDLTPIERSQPGPTLTVDDFLVASRYRAKTLDDQQDIFSALTSASARVRNRSDQVLTEDATHSLLSALKKRRLIGLSSLEHDHLSVVTRTVFEIQNQQASLDSNGLRYLISMRSFFIYNSDTSMRTLPRIKYRDVVWAFHSESQDILLDASIKACPDKLTWENAKALGIFLWLKSPAVLASQMELVGKNSFIRMDSDDRDPITASLFYLALRKKHIVLTFWKQAGGHADARAMLKFLLNDFETERWKTAALKNAYALLSKRRFLFAAVFFLLGDSLQDAVSVCVRQLDDFQLGIAIARVHGGDDGPVLQRLLEKTVLPFAFEKGYRWLASWSFWMLNRRDLAIQTIVTPLADLATRIPYDLNSVGSPMHEDPSLILLFAHLRSYSLQTVKGAIAVSGQTEFNFVLHMSRVLCRMGCHALALNLVRSWTFYAPPNAAGSQAPQSAPRNSRLSLRRLSTRLDINIPSNLTSRAPSPDSSAPGGAAFHGILRAVKKEAAAAPAEFDMSSFGF